MKKSIITLLIAISLIFFACSTEADEEEKAPDVFPSELRGTWNTTATLNTGDVRTYEILTNALGSYGMKTILDNSTAVYHELMSVYKLINIRPSTISSWRVQAIRYDTGENLYTVFNLENATTFNVKNYTYKRDP